MTTSVINRSQQLPDVVPVDSATIVPGRLLVYFPDSNTSCGGAAEASYGFFDGDNSPPWGTWVGYFEEAGRDISSSGYLLTWVPQKLVALVDQAIPTVIGDCLAWLDQTDLGLRPILASLTLR